MSQLKDYRKYLSHYYGMIEVVPTYYGVYDIYVPRIMYKMAVGRLDSHVRMYIRLVRNVGTNADD